MWAELFQGLKRGAFTGFVALLVALLAFLIYTQPHRPTPVDLTTPTTTTTAPGTA